MLILAVDSATPVAGVALIDENKLIREEFSNYRKTHSETLMPMIDKVLQECNCHITDLSALAITGGPGSFTGLRIGLATIKGLALAAAKPVISISTLEVLAHNFALNDALVCPLLDARRQEVYSACFDVIGTYPIRLSEDTACSPQEFIQMAKTTASKNGKERVILLGDGYYPYEDYFKTELGDRMQVAPQHLMLTRASSLASLAIEKYQHQTFSDVVSLLPRYVRLSEAEYKLRRGEL